jgi:hypothetical protein
VLLLLAHAGETDEITLLEEPSSLPGATSCSRENAALSA